MTEAERAHQYRLRQANKIISLFVDVHGRSPRTMEELDEWIGSQDGRRYLSAFKDRNGKIIPD